MKKVLFYTTGFFIIFIIVIISILAYLLSSAIGSTTRESDIIKNASEGYGFSIFKWERENFFDKWVSYINPFDNHKKIKSKDQIIEYFSLLERIAVNENLYSELFMENLDLKSEAQYGGQSGWKSGFDDRPLQTLKTDISGVIGRVAR